MDDFKDHPKSITEIKAERSDRSSDWTPRDVLIASLRDLDSGLIKPDALIVMWRQPAENGEEKYYHSSFATPDKDSTLGIIEHCKADIIFPPED